MRKESVNTRPDRLTVPGLVQALARRGIRTLRTELVERGFDDLRPVHTLVLVSLVAGSARASELAEQLGISRQAVGQMVATLETNGYLRRVTDPGDARAKLIVLSPRGRAALHAVRASGVSVEAAWAAQLGHARLAQLRATLELLLAGDPPADR